MCFLSPTPPCGGGALEQCLLIMIFIQTERSSPLAEAAVTKQHNQCCLCPTFNKLLAAQIGQDNDYGIASGHKWWPFFGSKNMPIQFPFCRDSLTPAVDLHQQKEKPSTLRSGSKKHQAQEHDDQRELTAVPMVHARARC